MLSFKNFVLRVAKVYRMSSFLNHDFSVSFVWEVLLVNEIKLIILVFPFFEPAIFYPPQVLSHSGPQLCVQGHLQENLHGGRRPEDSVLEIFRGQSGFRRRCRSHIPLDRLPTRLCAYQVRPSLMTKFFAF